MSVGAPANLAPTPVISQSQVVLYRECQRKWAWKYIVRVELPQTDGGALGDDVDGGQLQPYLREGREFDFTRESGDIAASGLEFLPQPKAPGLEVQRHFVMPSLAGLEAGRPGPWEPLFGFQGYIDLWAPDASIMPDMAPPPPGLVTVPCVADFKTTKDFRYAKDEKALREDVQANLYATWAMWSTGARVVDLVWIYFRTRGARRSKRTYVRVTAEDVVPRFLGINDTAKDMFALRQSAVVHASSGGDLDDFVKQLPVSVEMCEAYGGCPYRDRCNLSPAEIVEAYQAADAARYGALANPHQLIQLTKKAKDDMAQGQTANLFANLQAKKTAAIAAPAATDPAPPAPAPAEVVGINPPEKDLPPADPVGTIAAAPPPSDVAPAPAPAKRGRPRKDATAPAPTDAPTVAEIRSAAVDLTTRETFTLTWAEERYSPVQYNSFGVGPFSVTDFVRDGETLIDAMARVSATLSAFATQQRILQAEAFKNALAKKAAA